MRGVLEPLSLPPPSPQGGIASVSAHCRRRGHHEASYDGFLCLEILVILRDGVVFTPRRLTVGDSVPVFLVMGCATQAPRVSWTTLELHPIIGVGDNYTATVSMKREGIGREKEG
jgi:hypothetical protein